jgi:hypothetical protein
MSHAQAAACNCDHGEGGVCHCDHTSEANQQATQHNHGHHTHQPKTLSQRVAPYSRLITTIIVVLAFGIILSLLVGFSWLSVMEYWMGGYFVAFGLQQALSLKKSAAMFRQYDLLAKRVIFYSYALPFLQIALGLAYFFMLWWVVTSIIALIILLSNVIGVDKVIRQNEVVRCGCLGEGMNVPVGRVTLWENLIMIGMVVMMFTYHAFSYFVTGGLDTTSMPGMNM